MDYYLEVFSPEDAAEMQLAIEACGYKFNVVDVQADSPKLVIGSEGVEFDPDDLLEHRVIRFMIEPIKNPVSQGFEIARMLVHIREMLRAGELVTPETMMETMEMSRVQEAGPEMRERFDMLQRKFSEKL